MSQPASQERPDRGQLITIGVLVVMVACFVFVVYLPGARARKQMERQLQDRQAELAVKMSQTQELPHLVSRAAEMAQEYERELARIPSQPQMPEFLKTVADILEAEKITQREVVPHEQKVQSGYTELPVEITFEAPFRSAYRVLNRLESLDRVSRIDSVKFAAPVGNVGPVHVSVRMVIFHSSPAGKEAPGQLAQGKAAQS
jgi:Tfp pilus assembly protein PilO